MRKYSQGGFNFVNSKLYVDFCDIVLGFEVTQPDTFHLVIYININI